MTEQKTRGAYEQMDAATLDLSAQLAHLPDSENLSGRLLEGLNTVSDAFNEYRAVPTHHAGLEKEQHPTEAFAGFCELDGSAKANIGEAYLGKVLSLRTPGGVWFDDTGKAFPEANAFLTLCAAKGIDRVPMAVSSHSLFVRAIYDVASDPDKAAQTYTPAVCEHARNYGFLYQEALEGQKTGFESYRKMGILPRGNQERQICEAIALGITQRNLEIARQDASQREVLPILHMGEDHRHIAYSPVDGAYHRVPAADLLIKGVVPSPKEKMAAFVDAYTIDEPMQAPATEAQAKAAKKARDWHKNYAVMLATGQTIAIDTAQKRQDNAVYLDGAMNEAVLLCADSRTLAKGLTSVRYDGVMNVSAEEARYVLRIPGALITNDSGEITKLGALWVDFAEQEGASHVLIGSHADCGAMDVVRKKNIGQGDNFLPAFCEYGDDNKKLFAAVDADAAKGYEGIEASGVKLVGTDVEKFNQAMAVKAGEANLAVMAKVLEGRGMAPVLVYQHFPGDTSYVMNDKTGQYIDLRAVLGRNKDATCVPEVTRDQVQGIKRDPKAPALARQ